MLILFIGCQGETMHKEKVLLESFDQIQESDLKDLSRYNIYFGHQSVGYNIIDGIKEIIEEKDTIDLNIVETENTGDFTAPIFAHSKVGKNRDPISKIDAFSKYMEQGIGNTVHIAFFKFCYVDFDVQTDIVMIFNYYREKMFHLKSSYPHTIFVHVTVPLVARQMGLKSNLKKILGQPRWGYDDNIKRYQYNQLLRSEYQGKEPIFDLALVESTDPNGVRILYKVNGSPFHTLIPEYTYDGGHLNEKGRRIVSEQLLIFLAKQKNTYYNN